jgi:flagellar hook-basal body complex protein FliE
MTPVLPIGADLTAVAPMPARVSAAQPSVQGGFDQVLMRGLAAVDAKVAHADSMIEAFATGAPIPVHEVTIALEQARLSVELAGQVRTHLIETYREFMNMQV